MLTLDANIWIAAFDWQDRFHQESTAFLHAVARHHLRLHGPALVVLEAACALARRARSVATGQAALERLRAHPALVLHPMDARLLSVAQDLGLRRLLRGTDALYAATATLANAPLVSWDDELVSRADAITPDRWLAEHA